MVSIALSSGAVGVIAACVGSTATGSRGVELPTDSTGSLGCRGSERLARAPGGPAHDALSSTCTCAAGDEVASIDDVWAFARPAEDLDAGDLVFHAWASDVWLGDDVIQSDPFALSFFDSVSGDDDDGVVGVELSATNITERAVLFFDPTVEVASKGAPSIDRFYSLSNSEPLLSSDFDLVVPCQARRRPSDTASQPEAESAGLTLVLPGETIRIRRLLHGSVLRRHNGLIGFQADPGLHTHSIVLRVEMRVNGSAMAPASGGSTASPRPQSRTIFSAALHVPVYWLSPANRPWIASASSHGTSTIPTASAAELSRGEAVARLLCWPTGEMIASVTGFESANGVLIRHGVSERWYAGGGRRFCIQYQYGYRDGSFRLWRSSGLPMTWGEYREGRLVYMEENVEGTSIVDTFLLGRIVSGRPGQLPALGPPADPDEHD